MMRNGSKMNNNQILTERVAEHRVDQIQKGPFLFLFSFPSLYPLDSQDNSTPLFSSLNNYRRDGRQCSIKS